VATIFETISFLSPLLWLGLVGPPSHARMAVWQFIFEAAVAAMVKAFQWRFS